MEDSEPSAGPMAMPVPRRARRRRGRRLRRLLLAVAPRLLSGGLRILAWTVRATYLHTEELFGRWARGERVIVALWHDRALMMPPVAQSRGRRPCVMVSAHRDGEIATRALRPWGIHSVRGSATRGGVGGFLRLVKAYREGYDLAVLPDGPQGPRHAAKPGVIHLARATGAAIFPLAYAASRARRLRSWDRLLIPLPFSRVVYVGGEPLTVPRESNDDDMERLRLELQRRLDAVTAAADAAAATNPQQIDEWQEAR